MHRGPGTERKKVAPENTPTGSVVKQEARGGQDYIELDSNPTPRAG